MFEKFKTEIVAAAAAAMPNEMVGVIFDGAFIVCRNVHPDPENHFQMSLPEAGLYVGDKRLQAVVHSHPPERTLDEKTGKDLLRARIGPSQADMRQQLAMRVPWVLAAYEPQTGLWHMNEWGDHTLELPMLERPFVHGIEDCYTLIRKWWWQERAIQLSEYPRDDSWWEEDGDDLYMQNFEKEGFRRISPGSPAELMPGDVFLMRLAAQQYNHGGVFLGQGLLAHHAPSRLSQKVPVGPWFRRIDVWLRRPS